jgi:fatty acid desaturase
MKDNLWKIHNEYYDFTPYMLKHPGGATMLRLGQGRDCTELFESVHNMSPIAIKKMFSPFKVKIEDVSPEFISSLQKANDLFVWEEQGFYSELSKRARHYFKANKLSYKATPFFWIWASLLVLAWIISFAWWVQSALVIAGISTGFLGMSLLFCMYHTASHSALSHKAWVNNFWVLTLGNFLGFFNSCWKQHHIIGHHCYTGVKGKDPDIDHALLFMRKRFDTAWRPVFRYQHLMALPILGFFPGQWIGQVADYFGSFFTKKLFLMELRPVLSRRDVNIGAIFIVLSLSVHLAVPLWLHGLSFIPSLFFYIVTMGTTYWLIVFPNHDTALSHNPGERNTNDKEHYPVEKDWGAQQVTASASFKQPHWLSQLHGGMNYQIEHHLFPSVSPCHYRELSAIVKSCCQEYGIFYPYHAKWSHALTSYLKFISVFSHNRDRVRHNPLPSHERRYS